MQGNVKKTKRVNFDCMGFELASMLKYLSCNYCQHNCNCEVIVKAPDFVQF